MAPRRSAHSLKSGAMGIGLIILLLGILPIPIAKVASATTPVELSVANGASVCPASPFGGTWYPNTDTCAVPSMNLPSGVAIQVDAGVTLELTAAGWNHIFGSVVIQAGAVFTTEPGNGFGLIGTLVNYGTVNGDIGINGTFTNYGTVNISFMHTTPYGCANDVDSFSGTFINLGALNVPAGGQVIDEGIITNEAGGVITNYGTFSVHASTCNGVAYTGTLTNSGTVLNECGATFVNTGIFSGNPVEGQCSSVVSIASSSPGVIHGTPLTLTVTVADSSSYPTLPTGIVTWNDGGAGGIFSGAGSCTLSPQSSATSTCSIIYTPAISGGVITITASYAGDAYHQPSSGTATVISYAQCKVAAGAKDYQYCYIATSNFAGMNLMNANFQDAYLAGASFRGANLQGANMNGAVMQSASFAGANLLGASLSGANLQSSNFAGANLQNANLQGSNLQSANFQGANLQNTNLSYVIATYANFQGANLQGSNLSYGNFNYANFAGANTQSISITGATFVVASGLVNPGELAYDGRGNLYFATYPSLNEVDLYRVAVGLYTPQLVYKLVNSWANYFQCYEGAAAGNYIGVTDLSFDGQGNLYFIAGEANQAPTGTITFATQVNELIVSSGKLITIASTSATFTPANFCSTAAPLSGSYYQALGVTSGGGVYVLQTALVTSSGNADAQLLYFPSLGSAPSTLATVPAAVASPSMNIGSNGNVYFLTFALAGSTSISAVYEYKPSGSLSQVTQASQGSDLDYINMDQSGNLYFMATATTASSITVNIGEVTSQALVSGSNAVRTLFQGAIAGSYLLWVGDADNFVVSSSGEVYLFLMPMNSNNAITGANLYGLAPGASSPVLLQQSGTTVYGYDVVSMATVGNSLCYVDFAAGTESILPS